MNKTYHHVTNDLKTNVDVSLPQLSGAAPYQHSYQIPAFLGPHAGTRRSFQTLDHGKQRFENSSHRTTHWKGHYLCSLLLCSRSSTNLGPRLRFRDFTSYSRPAIDALHRQPTCKLIVRQRTMQINASCLSMCRRDTGRIIDLFLCTAQAGEVLAKNPRVWF
jgi:hypothetical protein